MKFILVVLAFVVLLTNSSAYSESSIVSQSHFQYFAKQPYSLQIYSVSFNTTCTNNSLLMSSIEGIINISYPCQPSNISIKFLAPKNKAISQYEENDWVEIKQIPIGITDEGYFVILTNPRILGTFKIANKTRFFDGIFDMIRDTSKLEKYIIKKDMRIYKELNNTVTTITSVPELSNSTVLVKKDIQIYEKIKLYIIDFINMVIEKDNTLYEGLKNWK